MIGLAFFVYKRPGLTRKVVESIRRNGFEKVYIFQDGLKYAEDKEKWKEVSEYIKRIDFMETEIHISDRNKGLANSIIDGMNYVFERHETAIALEDDILLSDGYKRIAEAMFEKYAQNRKVMGICGGSYGVIVPETYKYDVFLSCRMSSVAFGTWKDRWKGFQRDPWMLQEIYLDPEKMKIYENAGNDIEQMLFDNLRGKNDTWATYWELYQISCRGYHAIPTKGYAVDMGRTGGGENTKSAILRYDIALDGTKKENYRIPDSVFLDEDIVKDTRDLMNIANNKFQNYFDILCEWMKLYQNNLSTKTYFVNKGIRKVYIYGTGRLEEFLRHDITSEVEIVGYVVERRWTEEYMGRTVYDMQHFQGMENIPIIITPSYDIELIRHCFRKCNITNSLILIDDIVDYVRRTRDRNQ